MNLIIIRLIVMALAIFFVGKLTRLFSVDNFLSAIIAAIVLALVNTFVHPLLVVLTIPITIITLGIFLFFLNGLSLIIVSSLVPGFKISGCLTAAIALLLISFVNLILQTILI